MHEKRHERLVDIYGKRVGEKVCQIISTFAPCDNELLLLDAIADPMKAHVYTLGSFRLYCV